jgi:hypothetical protein
MNKAGFWVVMTLAVSFYICGCGETKMWVYKHEEERVDQQRTGNAGYICGRNPAVQAGREQVQVPKRELIGVDVKLPSELIEKRGYEGEDKGITGNGGYLSGGPLRKEIPADSR